MDHARRFELLHRIGIALSAERNRERLIETILLEAKKLCRADGGTLYLRTEEDELRFAIVYNDSLGIHLGGVGGAKIELDPLPMRHPDSGEANHQSVATHTAWCGETVRVDDAYAEADFDFTGAKRFDETQGYRSTSFLTLPLRNSEGRVIAVLQLINALDADGTPQPFADEHVEIVEALASQAGVALDNLMLLQAQKDLLEAFIRLIATAIDAKSPYTGGHCKRVPRLLEMLAQAGCEADSGPFADFGLNEEQWYELRIAGWLHDCGKIVTPVHVMDKATKLETIYDRIGEVHARFELLAREEEIDHLRRVLEGADESASRRSRDEALQGIASDREFIDRCNIGGEFLREEDRQRIREIGARELEIGGERRRLLNEEEIANLSIARGTLTEAERVIINGHMVQTIKMLEALPFPPTLKRVPEYAGGHHEKMDGSGYPKGIYAGDMSIPARMLAIADVFEALTAQDRPYKPGKTLSESMRIMGKMVEFNHLDPELFALFVRSGVYREYGRKYLPAALLDEVDEEALLAIEPKPFELPPRSTRAQRLEGFLPEYDEEAKKGERVIAAQVER